MIQAYQGRFKSGQFIPHSASTVPDDVEVVVVVIEGKPQHTSTSTAIVNEIDTVKKKKAIDSLIGVIPPDFDFDLAEIRQERIESRGNAE